MQEILISKQGDKKVIALLEDGKLEELYEEKEETSRLEGNIYLGIVKDKDGKLLTKEGEYVRINVDFSALKNKSGEYYIADYSIKKNKDVYELGYVKDDPDIYYQSVGSVMNEASSGQFPLNFTYRLVKYFDGENDGLVGIDSFNWGSSLQMVRLEKKGRGISHGDMIDLNRENLKGLDIREFYVQLVSDLRERGF